MVWGVGVDIEVGVGLEGGGNSRPVSLSLHSYTPWERHAKSHSRDAGFER